MPGGNKNPKRAAQGSQMKISTMFKKSKNNVETGDVSRSDGAVSTTSTRPDAVLVTDTLSDAVSHTLSRSDATARSAPPNEIFTQDELEPSESKREKYHQQH